MKITYQGEKNGLYYTISHLVEEEVQTMLKTEQGRRTLGEMLVADIDDFYRQEEQALKMRRKGGGKVT